MKNNRLILKKVKKERLDLSLGYETKMFVYVQRENEKPFNLTALMLQISATDLKFRCRNKLKKNEIVGVIFKILHKDIMVNIKIVSCQKSISTIRAEYGGIFIGLNNEQEKYIRHYVLSENLRRNKKRRMIRKMKMEK